MFWSYNKLFLLVEEGHLDLVQPGLTEIIPLQSLVSVRPDSGSLLRSPRYQDMIVSV